MLQIRTAYLPATAYLNVGFCCIEYKRDIAFGWYHYGVGLDAVSMVSYCCGFGVLPENKI
jgi:hypothetical protein